MTDKPVTTSHVTQQSIEEDRKGRALRWAGKAGATSKEDADKIYRSYKQMKDDTTPPPDNGMINTDLYPESIYIIHGSSHWFLDERKPANATKYTRTPPAPVDVDILCHEMWEMDKAQSGPHTLTLSEWKFAMKLLAAHGLLARSK